MTDFIQLSHPYIQTLKAYQPGKPIEEVERELGLTNVIKLASNENPLGPSPMGLKAAIAAMEKAALYPDGAGYALKHKLADVLKVPVACITLGNGSDNLLSLLIQAYGKNKAILVSEYSFDNYVIIARGHGVDAHIVPSKNWSLDIPAMIRRIDEKTAIIFIANPNNPTGTCIDHDALETLLKKTPPHVLVVSDEAYHEYAVANIDINYPKTLALQKDYPNLIITRTFSKAYGLAGMRVGYSITHPQIADVLNRIRLPFNASTPAMAAACAALDDTEHLRKTVTLNQQGKEYLTQVCTDLGIPFIPSATNFITIDMQRDAMEPFQQLLRLGVIVRPLHSYQMPHHLRITIGTEAENKRVAEALKIIK